MGQPITTLSRSSFGQTARPDSWWLQPTVGWNTSARMLMKHDSIGAPETDTAPQLLE